LPTSWPRLERLLQRDHAAVGTNGGTIVRLHDGPRERAALLLHGLTATPAQFVRYADGLYERGYNVVAPRLPRHGLERMSTELERLRPDELLEAVAECVVVASELGSRVTIAGFSLGGLLTAWAAQRFDVERCVAIAPFLGIAWLPRPLTPPLSALVLRLPNFFAWWDPIQRGRHTPEHGYPRYATHSIAHALNIASEVLRDAANSAPRSARIVLVNNLSETSVNNRATRTLYDRWSEHCPGVVEWETIRGLPLSHDIIEPLRPGGLSARAYPQLLHSIDPSAPQSESTTSGGR
jgi:pimeloyl-ACP methyl ester carboxylesterase